MTGKRWDGAAFTDLATRKRWDGTGFVDLTVGKRWDGTQWVDLFGPPAGGGTPTYVASAYADTTGTAPVTLPAPTGTQAGDVVIIAVTSWLGGDPVPSPGTWATAGKVPDSGTAYLSAVWARIAGTPPASWSVAGAASGGSKTVAAHTFRGCVATGQPFRSWRLGTADQSSTTGQGAAVTDAQHTDLVVQFLNCMNGPTAPLAAPAPWTVAGHHEYTPAGSQALAVAVATAVGNTAAPAVTVAKAGYWENGGLALIGA